MRKTIWFALILLVLTACSSEAFKPDTFSLDDMCIVQVDSDGKVCYGDSRLDAESLIGEGANDHLGRIAYANGVTIGYRDGKVVLMALDKDSLGKYMTARGTAIGDSKDDVKKLYGINSALDLAEYNLDYIYDTDKKEYYNGPPNISEEKLEKVHLISLSFNDSGVNRIMLLDGKMAYLLI